MTRLCTLEDLKTYKAITVSTEDVRLADAVERASRMFTEQTGYKWKGETATRYFEATDTDDDGVLWLDEPILSVTTLANGDSSATAITSAYYWLWPRNTPTNEGYWAIKLKSTHGGWEQDSDCFIAVTGVWGRTLNPPDDVVQAVTRWAAYLYDQKDAGTYDVVAFPESGFVQVPQGIPRDVQIVIDQRKRRQ